MNTDSRFGLIPLSSLIFTLAVTLAVTGCTQSAGQGQSSFSSTSSPGTTTTTPGSGTGSPTTGDTTRPTVTIASPTSGTSYTASSSTVTLSGNASDNTGVTQVSWTNSLGSSGTANGVTTWSANNIALFNGTNIITVRAQDAAGNIGTASLSVNYTAPSPTPGDTTKPTVTIASPTSGSTYTASSSTVTLTGNASDNVGVMQVTWSNSLGSSGTASGAATWSASNIALFNGTNNITVRAQDAAGNIGTASLAVNYSSGNSAYEGFGSNVTGGTGGTVVTVTSLSNSGAGSLRDALSGSNRIVQFAVAGTISLSAPITVNGTNVTIDGFTAPAPGITITSASDALIITGNPSGPNATGSNIIVRGLRFRNAAGDGIQIAYNAHDIVIDHNSMSASGDGEVDVTEGAYNVTISNNILSKNRGPGPSLLNTDSSQVSYHHNIYYGGNDRNPILTGGHNRNYSSGPASTGILADVRYNIMWNYGIGTYLLSSGGHVAQGNVVANLYRNNGSTNPSNVVVRSTYDSTARADAYIAGNVAVHDPRGCAYSYNSSPCFNYQTTNTQNNHAAFSAPAITGPAASDQQGRLNEWQAVKNGAGVISKYADDANDSEVRTAIVIPSISIFSAAWSD